MDTVLELPRKVIEGIGSFQRLPDLLGEYGVKKISIIADPIVCKEKYARDVIERIGRLGIAITVCTEVSSEPTFSSIMKLYQNKKLMEGEVFLAVGGGSVMDSAKLLSVMSVNPEFACDLERTELIRNSGRPFMAVPTTAGTGAEATPNAILYNEEKKKKIGIVSRRMIADTVILDGNLTVSLPGTLAACTGFDALAHAMESFTSKKANPYSDMFAVEAMRLIFHNIVPACMKNDAEARQRMLLASFYAGVCLVTASTHLVHAMAYPLAETFHVPHGKGIASLLAAGIRTGDSSRASEIMKRCLPEKYGAGDAGKLADVIEEYQNTLKIQLPLKCFGVTEADCLPMAEAAHKNERLFSQCTADITVEKLADIYRSLI